MAAATPKSTVWPIPQLPDVECALALLPVLCERLLNLPATTLLVSAVGSKASSFRMKETRGR